MYSATRDDVKKLAQQIEALAKKVQTDVDSGVDYVKTANELVRNNLTFVFALGEVYALEQSKTVKMKATVVKTAAPRWHNHRDSHGRFAKV
jgi:hypothetical protein